MLSYREENCNLKMVIKIKQHGEKWRMILDNEEWEFKDRKEFEENLKKILDIKEIKGGIN